MNIQQAVLSQILHAVPSNPPEIGGILGGQKGVIQQYYLDAGLGKACGCYYAPNIALLNRIIQEWSDAQIAFLGIFHTHFFGVATLSCGDQQYIDRIMRAMPKEIDRLYFPIIVLPDKTVVTYLAERVENSVVITQDNTIFV